MSEKENGFLTERDREFLTADGDYYTGENAKNQRYETREVIAERARQAFRDFALLYDLFDERERNRVFDPEDTTEFHNSLAETIAFLYHSLEGDAGSEPWLMDNRSYTRPFEQVLKYGVGMAVHERYPDDVKAISTVNFDVDVTPLAEQQTDWEKLIAALAHNELNRVDEQEIRTLLALSTNPTDRLRELADLIEEERDGDRMKESEILESVDIDEVADASRSLKELIEESQDNESGE